MQLVFRLFSRGNGNIELSFQKKSELFLDTMQTIYEGKRVVSNLLNA